MNNHLKIWKCGREINVFVFRRRKICLMVWLEWEMTAQSNNRRDILLWISLINFHFFHNLTYFRPLLLVYLFTLIALRYKIANIRMKSLISSPSWAVFGGMYSKMTIGGWTSGRGNLRRKEEELTGKVFQNLAATFEADLVQGRFVNLYKESF